MVEIQGITKSYGKKSILSGVSFSAERGQCIGILGANGSGKSTLLAILAGILGADAGNIRYNNEDALGNKKIFSKYTGYVPQDNPLIPELTVKDNLHLWYSQSGKSVKEVIKSGSLTQFGLDEHLRMPVKKLSGGMKKRLSLACALVNIPQILILDEPSVALDLVYKREIHEFIKDYVSDGGIVIITTHDETDLQLCDKIYLMKNGALVEVPANIGVDKLVQEIKL